METSGAQAGSFRERAGLKVTGTFFAGICIACYFGRWLPRVLLPRYPWWIPALIAIVPMVLLCWLAWRWIRPRSKADTEYLLPFIALVLCWAPLQYFRHHGWAAPAAGVVVGAYAWEFARSRGRSWPIAVMGCLLAGTVAPLVPWPNALRLQLVFTCFGLAVALQGAWEIVRHVLGNRPEPGSQPTASDHRAFLTFHSLVFGRIEYAQIVSPLLDQKVRARYKAEISELTRLGFGYCCSYAEAFLAFRLLLLFPAIVALLMLLKREVIRLGGGARFQTCHPLLTEGDHGAYAEAHSFGIQFYTAFTDGTFLVSGGHASQDCEGPVMTKRWRWASVAEIWADHRSAIEVFEAAGRRVDRRGDFETFADMSRREEMPDHGPKPVAAH